MWPRIRAVIPPLSEFQTTGPMIGGALRGGEFDSVGGTEIKAVRVTDLEVGPLGSAAWYDRLRACPADIISRIPGAASGTLLFQALVTSRVAEHYGLGSVTSCPGFRRLGSPPTSSLFRSKSSFHRDESPRTSPAIL